MTRQFHFYVYILSSLSGTLYIGVTNNLPKRVAQHKRGDCEGFTKDYGVDRLVYFERFTQIGQAIAREKQLKGWRRSKKIQLIKSINPSWRDLIRDWDRESEPVASVRR